MADRAVRYGVAVLAVLALLGSACGSGGEAPTVDAGPEALSTIEPVAGPSATTAPATTAPPTTEPATTTAPTASEETPTDSVDKPVGDESSVAADSSASVLADEAAVVGVVALGSGFGDPVGVEMPVADFSETVAWLTDEGASAVGLVTQTAQLWANGEPDCGAVAERLQQLGTPQEILLAAVETPDVPTSEVLVALHTSVLASLAACDPGAPSSAEHAWQWTVAYRRLVEIGVIR